MHVPHCTSIGIRSKQKHGGGIRTIAPNIRTIHRNSTWLRRKSNYAVPIKHTTLFLFPTNHKFKNPANFSAGSREKILFAKHEPGSNNHPLSCKHLANANVKPMKNTENTMKFPPTKRLRMDIHDLNICYPSCKLIPTHGKPPRQTQHVATANGWLSQVKCPHHHEGGQKSWKTIHHHVRPQGKLAPDWFARLGTPHMYFEKLPWRMPLS